MSSALAPVHTRIVTGPDLLRHIPDIARLRIAVFREYPYLYDGTSEYEERYLLTYAASNAAMAVLALDGDGRVVGASTGVPMQHETEEFKRPFREKGMDPDTIFYCGESVLDPNFRGQGIYRRFMEGREQYARQLGGFAWICFCAVVRPTGHPLRPENHVPLDTVWQHFGYTKEPSLITRYSWKDIDQEQETDHPMVFWIKHLRENRV